MLYVGSMCTSGVAFWVIAHVCSICSMELFFWFIWVFSGVGLRYCLWCLFGTLQFHSHHPSPPQHNESPTYMKFKCDGTIGPSPPFLTMCTITHLSFHVTFLSSIIMLHVKVKRAQPIHPQLFIQL